MTLSRLPELRPDHAGEDGTVPFQELSEAYRTLSDPERRSAYDLARNTERERQRRVSVAPGELVAEPLSVLDGEAR